MVEEAIGPSGELTTADLLNSRGVKLNIYVCVHTAVLLPAWIRKLLCAASNSELQRPVAAQGAESRWTAECTDLNKTFTGPPLRLMEQHRRGGEKTLRKA